MICIFYKTFSDWSKIPLFHCVTLFNNNNTENLLKIPVFLLLLCLIILTAIKKAIAIVKPNTMNMSDQNSMSFTSCTLLVVANDYKEKRKIYIQVIRKIKYAGYDNRLTVEITGRRYFQNDLF